MALENFQWLNVDAETAAKRLLGCEIVREIEGRQIRVRIVETEAYDQDDEASHAFRGQTKRNAAMFMGAGHLYVYFTYGMHYCMNIVCGAEGYGSGALIRAVEVLEGWELVTEHRGLSGLNATNGPAKTCAALKIDTRFSGHELNKAPIRLLKKPALARDEINVATRIGISKATERPRRFYITDNPYVSKR